MKTVILLVAFAIAVSVPTSYAQSDDCGCHGMTVADCAQKLVEIANKLVDTTKDLSKRMSALDADFEKYKTANEAVVGELRSSNKSLQEQITKMSKNLGVWEHAEAWYSNAFAANEMRCSDGSYMIGLWVDSNTNGLYHAKVICHKLNPATN
jgi:hypothetical protein